MHDRYEPANVHIAANDRKSISIASVGFDND